MSNEIHHYTPLTQLKPITSHDARFSLCYINRRQGITRLTHYETVSHLLLKLQGVEREVSETKKMKMKKKYNLVLLHLKKLLPTNLIVQNCSDYSIFTFSADTLLKTLHAKVKKLDYDALGFTSFSLLHYS